MQKDSNTILIRPMITEKAIINSENSVYVFKVDPASNKSSISKAVREIYKVTPTKVTTVTIPQKNVVVRGKRGKKAGYKKAYVYLRKGEKIEIN
jgi:large subunit ribosomal protein L23